MEPKEHELLISEIDDTDRIRVNFQDMATLKDSLETQGQIQLITVCPHPDANSRYKYKLVAGGRRMKAAKELGWKYIKAFVTEQFQGAEIFAEVMENLARSNMTWQENCLGIYNAVRRLEHRSLREGTCFTQVMAGKMLGVSNAGITHFKHIGKLLTEQDQEIVNAKSMEEAIQIHARRKLQSVTKLRAKQQVTVAPPAQAVEHVHVLATEIPARKVSYAENVALRVGRLERSQKAITIFKPQYVFTDIPFGIDMTNLDIKNKEVRDAHDVDENLALMQTIFQTAASCLPEDGAFFTFGDMVHFEKMLTLATAHGFRPQRWPVILPKPGGRNSAPDFNTTKNYECFFAFYKPKYRLAQAGADSISPWKWGEERKLYTHEFSKPAATVQALATKFMQPKSRVLDFCCGQGSVVKALADAGYMVLGIDKEEVHINHAMSIMEGAHRL